MALQVWMPLINGLNNNGVVPFTSITDTGTTITNDGKIGQCFNFGAGKRINAALDFTSFNAKAITFACWVNITSWNSSYDTIMSITDGTTWQASRAILARNNTSHKLMFSISNGSNYSSVTMASDITLNTWHHIACTYNGTQLKIYIDGILNSSANATLSIVYAGSFNIGAWTNSNSYPLNGKINDVRVYNECLSAKEVKELSHGLICHYLLEDNNSNNKLVNFSLSSEYQQVEYLESTGTQYIDTGIIPKNFTSLELDFMPLSTVSGHFNTILGMRNSYNAPSLRIYIDGTSLTSNYGDSYKSAGISQIAYYNTYHLKYTNGSFILNNISANFPSDTFNNHNYSLGMFSQNEAGSISQGYSTNVRIMRCNISLNNSTVASFIPCIRKADNKPGMYNLVNGDFLTNIGSGEFVTGPYVKQLPAGYGPLEYVQSTGTQYINTTVTQSDVQRIDLKYAFVSVSGYKYVFGSYQGEGYNSIRLLTQNNSTTDLYISFKSKAGASKQINNLTNSITNIVEGTITQEKVRFKNLTTGYIYQEDSASSVLFPDTSGTSTNQPIYLFAGNSSNLSSVKIYYFYVYNNNKITKQFVPALRFSDNVPGMYDLVNDIFYISGGTENLIQPPVINYTIYDTSGYCRNGVTNGFITSTSVTPRYLSAFAFNGINSCIKVPNFNLSNNWSISIWANLNSTSTSGWQSLYTLNTSGGDNDLASNIYINAQTLNCQFSANGGYVLTGNNTTTRGIWHHYCNTYNGSTVSAYIDGVKVATKSITNKQLVRHNLMVGAKCSASDMSTSTNYFNGQLSDFRVYNTVLSDAAVKELYETSMEIDSNNNIIPRILS